MEAIPYVERSASIAALAKALAEAQIEMHNPVKESVNPHFKSRYADLAAVRDAVLPVLGKHKLSVVQLPAECVDGPVLVTILMHESGEFIQSTLKLRAVKNDPQGVGSALTYARRYALQSLAGVAAEDDDDGNAASQPNGQKTQQQQNNAKPQPQFDPVNNPADFIDYLTRNQRSLKSAVDWLNKDHGTAYDDKTIASAVRADHRKLVCDAIYDVLQHRKAA